MVQKTSHIDDETSSHSSGGSPEAVNVVALWNRHKARAGGREAVVMADSGFSELVVSHVNESLARFCRELPVRRSHRRVLRRAAKLFVSNSSPAQIVSPTLRIS